MRQLSKSSIFVRRFLGNQCKGRLLVLRFQNIVVEFHADFEEKSLFDCGVAWVERKKEKRGVISLVLTTYIFPLPNYVNRSRCGNFSP